MKKNTKPACKNYPPEHARRGGCKVEWYYYKTEAEARRASEAAIWNRDIMREEGYSWGYQSPGAVTLMHEGEYRGLWEVVIP